MEIVGLVLRAPAIWLLIAVTFGLIEALTMGLTTIWFGGGALAASLVAMVTDSIIIQVVVFLFVSIALLYFTKPLAQKRLHIGTEKTNLDAIIGKHGVVIREIKPLDPGQVRVGGQEWTAIADMEGKTVLEGKPVTVLGIEGVKLVVAEKKD